MGSCRPRDSRAMTNRNQPFGPAGSSEAWPSHQPSLASGLEQITLRSPAELADALPYLLGFYPTDSVVMIALHGEKGRFGGRLRLGIPAIPEDWADMCDQLADCLITGCRGRGHQVTGVIIFVCQDPERGAAGGRSWNGSARWSSGCAWRAGNWRPLFSRRSAFPRGPSGRTAALTGVAALARGRRFRHGHLRGNPGPWLATTNGGPAGTPVYHAPARAGTGAGRCRGHPRPQDARRLRPRRARADI